MTTTPPEPTVFAPRACLVFGFVILAGFLFDLILGTSSRTQRNQIERVNLLATAVKDTEFIRLPSEIDLLMPLLEWEGVSYFPDDASPAEEDDAVMVKAGVTVDSGIIIYRKAGKESGMERDEQSIYIKLGPGEFMTLSPGEKKAIR